MSPDAAQTKAPTGQPLSRSSLPDPEGLIEEGMPEESPAFQSASGGLVGATARAFKGVPPCVWVANKHSQAITVVVSQFKPCRIVTKGGINASASGGGVDIEAQLYYEPATTKVISPDKSARFPLWSKLDDFGVVTIGKEGDDSYIKNDWIPAGAMAVYTSTEDLKLYDFKGKRINTQTVVLEP